MHTSVEENALREKLDELSHIAAKFKLSVRTAQDLAVTSASQLEENLETCRDDRTQCMDDLEVCILRNHVPPSAAQRAFSNRILIFHLLIPCHFVVWTKCCFRRN
jgi:hypothetical protein